LQVHGHGVNGKITPGEVLDKTFAKGWLATRFLTRNFSPVGRHLHRIAGDYQYNRTEIPAQLLNGTPAACSGDFRNLLRPGIRNEVEVFRRTPEQLIPHAPPAT